MPNVIPSIYLSDDDYTLYIGHKKEINERLRIVLKQMLESIKEAGKIGESEQQSDIHQNIDR